MCINKYFSYIRYIKNISIENMHICAYFSYRKKTHYYGFNYYGFNYYGKMYYSKYLSIFITLYTEEL